MGSYGLWSNTLRNSWGDFPQDLGVCLCNIYGHSSPYPLTLKPKKTCKSKQAKTRGGGGFCGQVLRESKICMTWMKAKQTATSPENYSTAKTSLTYPFLSYLSFFLLSSHLPLPISVSFSCYFSQKSKKGKHNKLQLKDKGWHSMKSCFCGVKTEKEKSLQSQSAYQKPSWPLTRNTHVCQIPFCFTDANSSSHLSDRRYWGNILRSGAGMSNHGVTKT